MIITDADCTGENFYANYINMKQSQRRFVSSWVGQSPAALFVLLQLPLLLLLWKNGIVNAYSRMHPHPSHLSLLTSSRSCFRCYTYYNKCSLLPIQIQLQQQRCNQLNNNHAADRSCRSTATTKQLHMSIDPNMLLSLSSSHETISQFITTTTTTNTNNDIGMLSKEATVIIFIIGIIPFIIATYEFWRRIAVGATFGTGTDSISFPPMNTVTTIGEDNAPLSSRGKQVLGQDSLITAYIIFATVAVVLGIVFYAVITSPPPS
jgi:hypothetical protein